MHISRRLYEVTVAHFLLAYFWLTNLCGRSPIIQPSGPVVSLTTHGKRVRTVYLAIESIARGSMLPSRIILWLDDEAVFRKPPAGVVRLARRGLEVRLCNNYGPHKKYYPYLESLETIDVPLVTADDDIFYPHRWLEGLVRSFQQFPDLVNCYRARVMELNEEGFAKYEEWKLARSTKSLFRHCAVGVAGTIFPPQLQEAIKQEGTAFLDCCPRADDLWLHVQALRAGYRVRQINERKFQLLDIPGTQGTALYRGNILRGDNDTQVCLTYRASDITRLQAETNEQ